MVIDGDCCWRKVCSSAQERQWNSASTVVAKGLASVPGALPLPDLALAAGMCGCYYPCLARE